MNFIEENKELLKRLEKAAPISEMDMLRLRKRLQVTTDRLEAVTSQAQAQFRAGDKHATFNKQTIESLNEPLFQGQPKRS